MAKVKLTSRSVDQTLKLGKSLGSNLKGGEIIELLSDLGSGKTTLTKGLAEGAGSQELVSSPSFTLCNEYRASDFTIYHFDFYRLSDPGIIRRELAEVMESPKSVIVIEWPAVIEDILPSQRLVIKITSSNENSRILEMSFPNELEYLMEGLK